MRFGVTVDEIAKQIYNYYCTYSYSMAADFNISFCLHHICWTFNVDFSDAADCIKSFQAQTVL